MRPAARRLYTLLAPSAAAGVHSESRNLAKESTSGCCVRVILVGIILLCCALTLLSAPAGWHSTNGHVFETGMKERLSGPHLSQYPPRYTTEVSG